MNEQLLNRGQFHTSHHYCGKNTNEFFELYGMNKFFSVKLFNPKLCYSPRKVLRLQIPRAPNQSEIIGKVSRASKSEQTPKHSRMKTEEILEQVGKAPEFELTNLRTFLV